MNDSYGSQDYGSQVRQAREAAGFSLRDLAKRARVSPAHLCDIELGRRKPGLVLASRLAELIGVSRDLVSALMTGTLPRNPTREEAHQILRLMGYLDATTATAD